MTGPRPPNFHRRNLRSLEAERATPRWVKFYLDEVQIIEAALLRRKRGPSAFSNIANFAWPIAFGLAMGVIDPLFLSRKTNEPLAPVVFILCVSCVLLVVLTIVMILLHFTHKPKIDGDIGIALDKLQELRRILTSPPGKSRE